jgi:hypothetical protein
MLGLAIVPVGARGASADASLKPTGKTDRQGKRNIGKHIVTPEGVTQTLKTAQGEREVLVGESNGSPSYRIVTENQGQLGYSPVTHLPTPYGAAWAVVDKGELHHYLEHDGQRYRVTGQHGGLVYHGPRGSHEGAIFDGPHILTPYGATRTMRTPEGMREVVVRKSSWDPTTYYDVVEVRGQPVYLNISPISTPYGIAQPVVSGDRLIHEVEIDGHKYEAREVAGGGHRYLDERGTEHAGTIRVGQHLLTPLGLTTTLQLRDGTHEVLVRRDPSASTAKYKLVRLGTNGESSYRELDGLATPYGRAEVAEKDGVLRRTVTWQGKTYDVDRDDPEHGVRFIDEHGNVQRGALFVGPHMVTPFGPTRTMIVDGVPQEVRIQTDAEHPERKTCLVYRPDGSLQPEPIGSYSTPFGEAEAIVEKGQLAHRLQVHGLRLLVSRTTDGDYVYTDARGRKHQGAIAFGGHWLTPDGVTQSRAVAGGVHEVITRKGSLRYELARVVGDKVAFLDLTTLHTAYGDAKLHVEGDKLDHPIRIGDRGYHAVLHGERVDVVDERGERYLDPFLEKVESKRPAPVTARRVRSKAPLAPLSDEPIVEISRTQHMARPVYDQLRDAMIEALTLYDPKTHYFIGLGSDPHPIVAFLENLGGKGLATNFPASGKQYDGLDPMVLDAYVRRLVPPEVLNGSKTLVFIDQTNSEVGREGTLAQMSRVFERYLRRIGSRARIERLAFSPNKHPEGTGVVDTSKYPEVGKFLNHPYEHVVSEYDRHVLGRNTIEQLVPRPEYRQFKGAMLERMKRDDKLDAFLRTRLRE